MPQPLPALFKLGKWAIFGAWHVLPRSRDVDKPRYRAHDIHHVLRIFLPVRRHMKMSARLEYAVYRCGKRRIHDTALVMTALGPGIGEKQVYRLSLIHI